MRVMNRNKTTVYYATYLGELDALDANGYRTGEKVVQYSDATPLRCNVKYARKGEVSVQMFGLFEEYDTIIVTEDVTLPIDENTVWWIDNTPDKGFDHVVKRIAKSLNNLNISVSKVNAT